MSHPAILVLESGLIFRGTSFGTRGETLGEVVFNTSMTGYQEILTDPSYAGQIIVMTAPQIGNTGVNREDLEAARPACAGLAIRELSPVASNWRSDSSLDQFMNESGLLGIEGIDTRALTRALRDSGAQRGAISTESKSSDTLLKKVLESPTMEGLNLACEVTTSDPYQWNTSTWQAPDIAAVEPPPISHHVVAYDFGIKRNILCLLREAGCRVTVVPAHTSSSDALALGADGYFLSNGPGDPASVSSAIAAASEICDAGKVVFGICLGHQILALALGAKTFKLPFGHHGGNHPVKDLSTGKVAITAQNHGFAVDPEQLPAEIVVTHRNLYDNTVAGFRHQSKPVFGIQYHPEASPGPHDASYLFAQFIKLMNETSR